MISLIESRFWRPLAIAIALFVHLGLVWLYYTPATKGLAGDEKTYLAAAQRLQAGDALEPSLWPPLYAHFLALLGADEGRLWPVQLVQTLLLIATAVLLTAIARRMLGPGPGAFLAGLLVVTYPPLVAFAHYLWPEILHLVLFLAALWIVTTRHEHMRWMPPLGLLLGLALHSKSLLLPFVPILLLGLLRRNHKAASLGRLAVAALVLTLAIAPTAVTNFKRSGSLSLSSSAWFNIWAGLRDTSRRSLIEPKVPVVYREYRAAGTDLESRNAAAKRSARSLVHDTGLVATLRHQLTRQYFRLFDKDSFLTAHLPGAPLASIGQGYRGTSRPVAWTFRWASYSLYGMVLLGAVAGLVVYRPRDLVSHRLVIAFLVYNLALFLILHVKSRYRIQMMPFLFLYAGGFVNWAYARSSAKQMTPPLNRRQQALCCVGGAIIMFLAYGAALLD